MSQTGPGYQLFQAMTKVWPILYPLPWDRLHPREHAVWDHQASRQIARGQSLDRIQFASLRGRLRVFRYMSVFSEYRYIGTCVRPDQSEIVNDLWKCWNPTIPRGQPVNWDKEAGHLQLLKAWVHRELGRIDEPCFAMARDFDLSWIPGFQEQPLD